MNWFLDPIKNHYADFNGRVTRKPYWMFVLSSMIVSIILSIFEGMMFDGPVLSGIYALAIIVPSIALAARRLHDTGRSGWWQLIALVPFVGFIVLIVFLAQDTSPETNAYGPSSKGASPAPAVPV